MHSHFSFLLLLLLLFYYYCIIIKTITIIITFVSGSSRSSSSSSTINSIVIIIIIIDSSSINDISELISASTSIFEPLMFPIILHQCTALLFFKGHNGNKFTQLFSVIPVIVPFFLPQSQFQ